LVEFLLTLKELIARFEFQEGSPLSVSRAAV